MLGLYTLAACEVPRRITATLASMALAGTLVVTYVRTRGDVDGEGALVFVLSAFMAVALTVPPVLLGLYVGARRRLMESLQERADSLERELSLLADGRRSGRSGRVRRSGRGSRGRCTTWWRTGCR